jgi:hypothetical protein
MAADGGCGPTRNMRSTPLSPNGHRIRNEYREARTRSKFREHEEEVSMLKVVTIIATLLVGAVSSASAQCGPNCAPPAGGGGNGGGTINPAPAPIAGAGLPILTMGCGVYWLIRRRRTSLDVGGYHH